MASAKEMLMDIIEPTVERQYGGGLDDAYMNRRRSSAFADPNANSAFASPMSQGGLPTIYRQDGGDFSFYGNYTQDDIDQAMDAAAAEEAGFDEFDQADADAGAAGRATPKGQKPEDSYISYDSRGRVIQTGSPADEALNQQNLAAALKAGGQDYRDRFDKLDRIDPDSKLTNLQLAQRGIDRGIYNRAGIPLANLLEDKGLATFGKGMRGPFESSTPGGALYRYADDERSKEIEDSDKRGVYGEVGFEDSSPESKEFEMRMRYAKPGETIEEIAKQMFDETKMVAPTQNYGYSSNSNAQATQVWDALNDARGAGMIQGLGLLAMGASSPGTFMSTLGSQYDNGETRSILGQIGKTIGDKTGLTSLVGDSKIGDRVKTAVDLAERGPGIFTIEPRNRRSVDDDNFRFTEKLMADRYRIPEEGEKIDVDKVRKEVKEQMDLQSIALDKSKERRGLKEKEETSKQKPTSFVNKILNFLKSSGSPAIPNQDDLGASNDVVEKRKAQPKLTQKQVAAIAQEAAKIPEEVQKTITSAGLLPQYLALIRAGYTAERAIKAIGLPAGTAIE